LESIEQIFKDLSHDGVVMNLAAHPDDEDGATLAYYRMKYGVRTHSILFTRGEGGQNEIGPELYEELAVIRTDETKRAGEIIGAQVDFLNLLDFGFSKSATEAFAKWGGRQEVVRRLVYMIRKYQPDILFTNHSTGGGHGHHQAVAVTAIAAFDAAADPDQFPEQLNDEIDLWQPKKLYLRILPWNGGNPDVIHLIRESHGEVSYIDIANQALREHRSQGLGSVDISRFTQGRSEYRLARRFSSYPEDSTSFFGGIAMFSAPEDSMLIRFREQIDKLIGTPAGDLLAPAARLLNEIAGIDQKGLKPLHRRIVTDWKNSLERLVKNRCQLQVTVRTNDSIVVPGQEVPVHFSVSSSLCGVRITGVTTIPAPGWLAGETARVKGHEWRTSLKASSSAVHTFPPVIAQYRDIESTATSLIQLEVEIDGITVVLSEHWTPSLAPPYELSVTPVAAWVKLSDPGRGGGFNYRIINRYPHKSAGSLNIDVPEGWRGEEIRFTIDSEDAESVGLLYVRPPKDLEPGDIPVRFSMGASGVPAVSTSIRLFDVEMPDGLTVGIIRSYDNTLEMVTAQLGVPFTLIEAGMLESGDLGSFSTIVVDIRAYSVREDLREHNERLLEYISNGGNLVVFYHKPQDWEKEYAPYPFTLSRERVSVEEAPVRVLLPDHDLMNVPNLIIPEDWDGWVQERGVYFPDSVSGDYERLISSHDPDEPALDTGLLAARYGKGTYIYSSYVWYRQMKELHRGAIKCYANFISYGHQNK
ncbi:MAG: PIG-L family deacetylase, partial [Ignavibacteria bacterium]|nr:PIG-L family deacetylase [Ignavibacteria bacterium]